MGMITLSHYPYILCHFGIYVPDMVPKTFQACHLCTFNVATIFGGAIPTSGVLPYAMIYQ